MSAEPYKDIVIIYHSPCLDGFGGAYAAWKKFGDSATYLPMRRSKLTTEGLAGKDVYFIDFTYPQDLTDQIVKEARSVTILDHHTGVKTVVESVKNHVFDENHSGAVIAWHYFHPKLPLPRMLAYIEDIDLFRKVLPHCKEAVSYLSTVKFDFAVWEKLVTDFDDDIKFEEIIKIGGYYAQYSDIVVEQFMDEAYPIEFEGYKILTANVANFLGSTVANRLWEKHDLPFALTWHADGKGVVRYSMRGRGEVDLAAIAQKYGGNGLHNAAGFNLPPDTPPPFKRI
ncbi:MAG TPA: hypothetical protein VGP13_01040 [Candidatus Paceibacterota bacterium]|jgi:hypothetical protein|nr:hypothetical protein [Candidatus Paceibacterota bacterium]